MKPEGIACLLSSSLSFYVAEEQGWPINVQCLTHSGYQKIFVEYHADELWRDKRIISKTKLECLFVSPSVLDSPCPLGLFYSSVP